MMCPAKDKTNPAHRAIDMVPQPPLLEAERANYAFFLDLPEVDRTLVKADVKVHPFCAKGKGQPCGCNDQDLGQDVAYLPDAG
jgi:hypothetical protein